MTYFRSHVTEHLAVIGTHSGVRVTKRSMAVSQTLTSLAMEGDGSDHVTLGSSTGLAIIVLLYSSRHISRDLRSEDYPYNY